MFPAYVHPRPCAALLGQFLHPPHGISLTPVQALTGEGTGLPSWPRMNIISRFGRQFAHVPVEVETIQALNFQCDVPVQ
jgi:hypothetical protein